MSISVSNQTEVFLIFVVIGIICGMLFDIFRAIRRIIPSKTVSTTIQDISFWIICTTLIFFSGVYFNQGEIRYYQIIGAILGCTLYGLIFSKYVLSIMLWMYEILRKAILCILKIILYPIALIIKFVTPIIRCIERKLSKLLHGIMRKIKGQALKQRERRKKVKKRLKML